MERSYTHSHTQTHIVHRQTAHSHIHTETDIKWKTGKERARGVRERTDSHLHRYNDTERYSPSVVEKFINFISSFYWFRWPLFVFQKSLLCFAMTIPWRRTSTIVGRHSIPSKTNTSMRDIKMNENEKEHTHSSLLPSLSLTQCECVRKH